MVFRYRLIDTEGQDLGPFVSSESNWQPGYTIPRGAGDVLCVTAVIESESDEFLAYLVVEKAA